MVSGVWRHTSTEVFLPSIMGFRVALRVFQCQGTGNGTDALLAVNIMEQFGRESHGMNISSLVRNSLFT